MFESETGEAVRMTKEDLRKELSNFEGMKKLELVFVAACQSEFVGELFKEAGAQHVICVDKKRSVLDEVAIDFTLNLYQRVLDGTKVCKAFQISAKHS